MNDEEILSYNPWDGMKASLGERDTTLGQFRVGSIESGRAWRYNPFTGIRRAPGDIASDPYGRTIVPPNSIVEVPTDNSTNLRLRQKPWKPYVKDFADGVKGHYCIARYNPDKLCHEFWKPSVGWCSAGMVYRFDEVAAKSHQHDTKYWRNDAVLAAVEIAERHGQHEVAADIRSLLS